MECIKDRWLRPFGGYKTTERRILDHYANVVTLIAFPRLWKVYRKVGRLIARFNYLGAFEEERGFVELSDSKSWSFAIIIT